MTGSWWKSAVLYQIYPRSFQDANGDGIGDLAGITARLPYLAELGVDALWLSPIFVSPMADFGYDISDYTAIDSLFGSLGDFDALLREAHARGLKVLLDLVPNHTSIEHPWFKDSRASRESAKRDWYIWRDPAPGGGPPNNWLSEFGGSAWAFDERTGQYYYHAFLPEQPDLNWRNGDVRAAMHEVMRFWLKRGVDGFRVDVIWHLIKDAEFRDNPPNPEFREGDLPHRRLLPFYSADRPEVHEVIRELRAVVDEFSDRLLIGEIYLSPERLVTYYGKGLAGAHLPFNFSLIETPWSARAVAKLIDRYEALLPPGAWPNWVLGNHDRPRIASRVGDRQARVAAMLLLTLRGTPTLYYGDEIGLPQVQIPRDRLRDPVARSVPALGRDGCRTPMQWDASRFCGFSAPPPWLPLSEDAAARNVAVQSGDPGSPYNLYRRLLSLRRRHPALAIGGYRPIPAEGDMLAYIREQSGERLLVALNFGSAPASLSFPYHGTVALSLLGDRSGESLRGRVDLAGNDGLLVRLD
ncbi:MAG TPA: alpha-amylase family glycosyl hydrolase [Pseudolabrys sp.]|nr:alpha-amylase family glycosyl hydrolase [Pseudolabrys sp.]